MPKVEFSPLALEDLQEIRHYITTYWDEKISKRILKKIMTEIRVLEENPKAGVNLAKVIEVPTDYRYLFTEKNYVFYRLGFDKIRVVRILNERQDYMMQLFGINTEEEDEYWKENE